MGHPVYIWINILTTNLIIVRSHSYKTKRGRTPYVRRSSRNRPALDKQTPIEQICRPTVIVTPQPAETILPRVPTSLADTTIVYTPIS
ncbi:hypothetical protein ALC57_15591 [Trachymyrmex cornetzi]|uniref:Uncharacterized protein n=1 Tax=Trachymyrmex cornetzi TaxID=471704 RepID=A0A151IWN2_9HYME|nr:hypothetical protein ALC57_15591 [Trachymyrmex cornetzi]